MFLRNQIILLKSPPNHLPIDLVRSLRIKIISPAAEEFLVHCCILLTQLHNRNKKEEPKCPGKTI